MAILIYETNWAGSPEIDSMRREKRFARCSQTHRKVRNLLFLIAITTVCALPTSGETQSPTEYQVKAAFLYNFARFVEWTPKAFHDVNSPFAFCVLGEDPFGPDLERTISGKTVNAREIVVRRLKGIPGLENCHILFIGTSESGRITQVLHALKNTAVLTVGETEGFLRGGGIISFFVEDNKIRFEINVDNAERSGLKISSRLLKLAKVIKDERKN